jgi:hypothetical protein
MQPKWRGNSWPLLTQSLSTRRNGDGDGWGVLRGGGKDGFSLVLISLSWALEPTKPTSLKQAAADEILNDVIWVLRQMAAD